MKKSRNPSAVKEILSLLGPGLITGASDDDPSGIATYSQAGAQFGFGMLWTTLFSFPLMCAVQEISAWIGRVTGHGLAGNIRRHYSSTLLYAMVALLFIANTINLGADLGAMAEGVRLIIGGSALCYVVLLAVISLLVEIFVPYKKYVFFLKWLTLVLFAYVATVFAVHVPWKEVLKNTVWPTVTWNAKGFTMVTAILGTTISPYLFFWQASEEAEEVHLHPEKYSLTDRPDKAAAQLRRIRIDTSVGMAISNAVAFFIILTAAVTLHAQGIREINTAAEAASALKPLAGPFAFFIFTFGIIGTGLLAVPVLAGSTAYAVGEALHWPVSLQSRPKKAKGFYAVLAVSVLLGMVFNFFKLNAIKALYWAAVLNGIVSVPVIAMMMLMTTNPKIMGHFAIPLYLRVLGWLSLAVMAGATAGLFVA